MGIMQGRWYGQGRWQRRTMLAAIALVLTSPASAQGTIPQGTIPQGTTPPSSTPVASVTGFVNALDRTMKSGATTPFKARFDQLAPAVDRAFDLGTILSVSIGARWSSIDDAVKTQLADVFRTYTIASYVANFGGHGEETFRVDPATRISGADQIVRTLLVPRSGDAVKLDYVMRQSGGDWRVVDVLADGTISRVAVQRSDFRALLGREGNTAALLDSLRRKIADLSGGALG